MITLFESKCDYVKDDEAASKRIALLESELARKNERIAELEQKNWEHERELAHARVELEISRRERDEARQWLINWEWERIGGYWKAKGKTKSDLAEMVWPGQGDHLFPEES